MGIQSSTSAGSIFKHNKYIKLAIVAGLVVVVDQITKMLISNYLPLYSTISVIPGFFNLIHIHNPGGAFGFLANQSSYIRNIVFLCVSFLAICLILWFYKKTPKTHPALATAFAMIFGGAIGNLIDRVRFGKVVDFLDFYLANLHWPAFNIADSSISIGIAIFAFHLVFKKMPE